MRFSKDFDLVLERSRDEAMRTGHRGILPEHILLAMTRLKDSPAATVMASLGVDLRALKRLVDDAVFRETGIPYSEMDSIRLCEESQKTISYAVADARVQGTEDTGSIHLLTGLCRTLSPSTRESLSAMGVTRATVGAEAARLGLVRENKAGDVSAGAELIADALEAEIRKTFGSFVPNGNVTS